VLAGIALGSALAMALIPWAQGFVPLLAAVALAACFGTSMMPMGVAVSLANLGSHGLEQLGKVRVWGTVSFLISVACFPWLLHRWQAFRGLTAEAGGPSEPGLGVIFWIAGAFTLCAGAVVLRLHGAAPREARARAGDLALLLRHPPFRRILVFAFLAYLCLQGPILLFPTFLSARGGDLATIGSMWIPMLALEIPLVWFSGAGLRRFGARTLVCGGVAADGLRWLGCALAPNLTVMLGLQLLHGVVVAGLILGVALYVEQAVPERLRASGQGIVAMLGVSLAGMLSSVLGGALQGAVSIDAPYYLGGGLAILLAISGRWFLPSSNRPHEDL
jgi:MFS family permease